MTQISRSVAEFSATGLHRRRLRSTEQDDPTLGLFIETEL